MSLGILQAGDAVRSFLQHLKENGSGHGVSCNQNTQDCSIRALVMFDEGNNETAAQGMVYSSTPLNSPLRNSNPTWRRSKSFSRLIPISTVNETTAELEKNQSQCGFDKPPRRSMSLSQINLKQKQQPYTDVWAITSEQFVLLVQVILQLLVLLGVYNPPTTLGKYKALVGEQYIQICIEVLSKVVNVDFGSAKSERIKMIIYISKSLQCDIKINEKRLLNPLSSSTIKLATLFLHWICCRARLSLYPNQKSSLDTHVKNFLAVMSQAMKTAIETGRINRTELQKSFHQKICQCTRRMDATGSAKVLNEPGKDNTAMEMKYQELIKSKAEKRKQLMELKSKLEQARKVNSDKSTESKLKIESLRKQIAALKELKKDPPKDESENRICDECEKAKIATWEAELEQLERGSEHLKLQLYKLYKLQDIRATKPELYGNNFIVPNLKPNHINLDHFLIWIEAMESLISVAQDEMEQLKKKDFSLKNRYIIDKLAKQYGMSPEAVVGIQSTVADLEKQLMLDKLQLQREILILEEKIQVNSFEYHELETALDE